MEKLSTIELRTDFQVASMELVYRPGFKIADRPKVTSARMAYNIFRKQWNDDTILLYEEFKVMCLNSACRVLGIFEVSAGGLSGTVVDSRLTFAPAILACASSIIIAHNHPSQNLSPSSQDKLLTEKLVKAGKLLEIPVCDHLIIGTEQYYSFSDEGLL